MTKFRHISGVFKTRSLNNKGNIMDPEREALRLSAVIAFCVGAFVIMWSVDIFEQNQGPALIGEVQCSWWGATLQRCDADKRSLSSITERPSGILANL